MVLFEVISNNQTIDSDALSGAMNVDYLRCFFSDGKLGLVGTLKPKTLWKTKKNGTKPVFKKSNCFLMKLHK